jgi:hypothetical protein
MLFLTWFISGQLLSQILQGNVFSNETKTGIGFVNIGVIGRNLGTVSDKSGHFNLDLNRVTDKDSLRFSIIGYNSKSFLVGQLRQDSTRDVYLSPRVYSINELKVVYHRPKRVELGTQVSSGELGSGFGSNDLGSELAVKVHARGRVRLEDINLNITKCTYDTVTYRLNVYQLTDKNEYKNIMTRLVYISFTKDRIKEAITFDLSKYSIIIEGDVMIALELYRDLGEGNLFFRTQYFTGTTYHRKSPEGKWSEAAGVVGIYLRGIKLNQ